MPTRRSNDAGSALAHRLPLLCLVTDLDVVQGSVPRLLDAVQRAVTGGVDMVQVRWRAAAVDRYNGLLEQVVDTVAGNALVVANLGDHDVRDLSATGVNGYHLPEARAGEIVDVRAAVGVIIGASVHSADAASIVASQSPDYLMLGTLYPTASHPDARPAGTRLVTDVMRQMTADVPVIGIGGVQAANAADVLRAGASGVAVIRAILDAPDPRAAASRLRDCVHSAWDASRAR